FRVHSRPRWRARRCSAGSGRSMPSTSASSGSAVTGPSTTRPRAGAPAWSCVRTSLPPPSIMPASATPMPRPPIFRPPGGGQAMVRELAAGPGALLLAGRFEGIDERLIEARALLEVSIGDYVLSGGELAAMVLIDAVVRLLPGVVGQAASLADESFETGLLE